MEVDSEVLVSNDGVFWKNRHFAKYTDGVVRTWVDGGTLWSKAITESWNYAKLVEDEEHESSKD